MKIRFNSIFAGILSAITALFLPKTPALGTSYPVINATTKTNLTDQNANVEEQLWSRKIIQGADFLYQENPFADGMMGEGDNGKAIVRITDTEKVAGTTIHITTMGGLGGPGSQGNADRIGNEQKLQIGSFDVKIGRQWFGVGVQQIAKDETMIGTRIDKHISDGLRALHAQKRSDDILMLMRAHGRANARNILFPAGKAEATLKTANTLSTALLSTGRNKLSGNGGVPMALGPEDSGGSRPEAFVCLSSQYGIDPLENEDAYIQALRLAQERGDKNPLFKGNVVEWNAMRIYRWFHKDHGNWGPIGSPICARAYLSAATAISASATTVLSFGGSAAAAATTPTPEYTRYFQNSPWTYHWGDTIAAVTATDRYILIIDAADPTIYSLLRYRLNDGKNITTDYTGSVSPYISISGFNTSARTWAAGSLVVQANVLGTPFGYSLLFGREVIAAGMGTINGSKVNPQFGKRTEEHRNHDLDHAYGAEGVWGAALVKRADNVAPGFVLVQHAITVAGAPAIT